MAVCDRAHPWVRLAVIFFFTMMILIISQYLFEVFWIGMTNLLGVEKMSESQVVWMTVFLIFLFIFFMKFGLNEDLETFVRNTGFINQN